MTTGEQVLAPSISASRIREPRFSTVKRGYDPSQVLEYLSRIAEEVEALQSRTRRLESDLAMARRREAESSSQGPATSGDPYDGLSSHVVDVMRTFDQDVDRLRKGTEAEAERTLAEARREADRVRFEAQTSSEEAQRLAERALEDTQKKAGQVLGDLAAQREVLLRELRTIRDHMIGATRTLDAVMEEAPAGDKVVVVEDASNGERLDASSSPARGSVPESGM